MEKVFIFFQVLRPYISCILYMIISLRFSYSPSQFVSHCSVHEEELDRAEVAILSKLSHCLCFMYFLINLTVDA